MSTSFSHNFDRFVFLMRMIFLYYLDQESHALMTDLEKCLDQEVEKKSSTRVSSFHENQEVLDTFFAHKLFQHLHYVHNEQPNFKIRCELRPLCGAKYSTFAGYKVHIYREHKDLSDEDLSEKLYQ